MERASLFPLRLRTIAGWFAAASLVAAVGGCSSLLATGVYVMQGGNMIPPEFSGLKDHRVVVICRPPSSNEYRHAGASRAVSQRVSELLVDNVRKIDVVNPHKSTTGSTKPTGAISRSWPRRSMPSRSCTSK